MEYIKPEMDICSFLNNNVVTTSNADSGIEWDEGWGDVTVEMPD